MLKLDYILDRKINDIIYALEVFSNGDMPHTSEAVSKAADAAVGIWVNMSKGAFKRTTGAYIHGIENGKIYPYKNDRFSAAVVNNSPHAKIVEEGVKPFDMKTMLYTSRKVRISKKGKRYLIIPFRHRVKDMPEEVLSKAKEITPSHVIGKRTEGVQQGAKSHKQAMVMKATNPEKVTRLNYKWGGRARDHLVNAQTQKAEPTKYDNMVKFPRESAGVSGHQYMTFRVMHEDSDGWHHPGIDAKRLGKRAAIASEPVVSRIVEQGFLKDKKVFEEMFL